MFNTLAYGEDLLYNKKMKAIEFSEKVRQSILEQLATPDKPGLISPKTCASHADMDYPLLLRGVTVINTHIFTFARAGELTAQQSAKTAADVLKKTGLAAEADLLNSCEGKNVLKGTLFACALITAAYFRLQSRDGTVTELSLMREIAALAAELPSVKGTHGADVTESYGVTGALGSARNGYKSVFTLALPLYRGFCAKGMPKAEVNLRVLLRLIAVTDDTCVYYRQGSMAEEIKTIADYLCNNYNADNLSAANAYFDRCHISTGGSGDLLTVTILLSKLFPDPLQ